MWSFYRYNKHKCRMTRFKRAFILLILTVIAYFTYLWYTSKQDVKLPPHRIRGIPSFKEASYALNEKGKFVCHKGEKFIPFEYVNDDFCDCPDGSDEPGTSACSRYATTPTFYCDNQYWSNPGNPISSSLVNDGICDCCDGSDEWMGLVKCPKHC